jgi:hypothetical protein
MGTADSNKMGLERNITENQSLKDSAKKKIIMIKPYHQERIQ